MNWDQFVNLVSDPSQFESLSEMLAEKAAPPVPESLGGKKTDPAKAGKVTDPMGPKTNDPMSGLMKMFGSGQGAGEFQTPQAPAPGGPVSVGTKLNPQPILQSGPEDPAAAMALGELFKRGVGL